MSNTMDTKGGDLESMPQDVGKLSDTKLTVDGASDGASESAGQEVHIDAALEKSLKRKLDTR
jgi:hypothetical protein